VELAQLRYFATIAETLSFTQSAELLHLSQPALSYQMKRLEAELGVRLFDRHGRRIALTSDGELFLPLAQGVISRANEAVRVLRDQSGVETGEVCMGSAPSIATYLVPNLLASFHQVFPRVRVALVEGGDLLLHQRVYTGSMDFAIVSHPGSPQSLDITALGSEDLLVVTSPTHRVANRPAINLAELRDDDFVFPFSQYHLTVQVTEACRRAGFEPNVTYQAGSLESLKNMVREGLGVSILPSLAVSGVGRTGLQCIRVRGRLTRELYLIRGKERDLTRAAQVLMTHVRTSVTEHMQYPVRSEQPFAPKATEERGSKPRPRPTAAKREEIA
jgi:DNA-binding transcriptional LysR family regulator